MIGLSTEITMKAALTIALLIGALASQQSSTPTARVLSAKSWKAGKEVLSRESTVPVDGELVASAPGGLLLDCPNELVAYSCRGNDCHVKACGAADNKLVHRQVLRSKVQASSARGWTDALFRREPREPVIAVARAGGNPVDAVLLTEARGVHWGPALTRVLEGRHCFRLTSLPANPKTAATSFSLDWDRSIDAAGVQAVPGVGPGLYMLEKGRASAGACEPDADGMPSWVLIASAASHDQLSAAWREENDALSKVETEEVDVATMRAMRHAVLAVLADQAR
jgi:hypothetical protein